MKGVQTVPWVREGAGVFSSRGITAACERSVSNMSCPTFYLHLDLRGNISALSPPGRNMAAKTKGQKETAR